MTPLRAPMLVLCALALAVCGCDQLALGPKPADSAPAPAPEPATVLDLRPFAGQGYGAFAARPEMARYAPGGLNLTLAEQTRFEAAMAAPAPAWITAGGGAEALVFAGCAPAGCDAGHALLAIDLETGAVFAGVRDAEGVETLAPNPRLEALLRLSSPTRAWEDLPHTPQQAHAPPR